MNLPDPMGPLEGILTPPRRSVVARVLTALLLVFAVVLVSTAIQLHRNIGEVRAAESDNKVWNIVQFEVDYRDLRIAVLAMSDSAARKNGAVPEQNLRALRLEFDIFYSRINALFATLTTGDLRPIFQVEIDALDQARTDWATRFDALTPAPELPDIMVSLSEDVAALEPLVRRLSVDVLQVVVARAEAARLQEGKLLATMFGASIALIGLTILSVILSVRLGRSHAAAETSLERSTALAKAAFESSVTAMLICDDQGRILLTNPAASVVFGHHDADLLGHNLQDRVIPPERMAEYRRFLRFIRQTGEGGDATIGPVQVAAQRATGEVFPAAVLVRITQLDAAQRLILVFVQDISDQVEFEQRLQAAADEARRYATAQGRFLATMSHELRTPLHGVRAALDLLARKKLPAEATSLVGIALQSCAHALQQTDSALHAIRATHENEADVPFDPVRIAQDLSNEMRLIGKVDGTKVSFSVSGARLAQGVVGRPRAFTRALGNLIANATKYARGGTVKVKLTFTAGSTLGHVLLKADVIDDGPGIPADKIDRIFEPFNHDLLAEQKADGAGFGLGLSIVKQAIEVMEGDIAVISDCGKGCHVTITLKLDRCAEAAYLALEPPNAPHAQPVAHRPKPNAVALVVDDAQVNCKLVGRMLSEMGYRVDTAFSGADAIAMAATTAYDLILMDFYMPMMTGIEAARHIRADGASAQARIIGITARVDLIGSDEGNPPEMNGVLFKPFGITELETFLAEGGSATAHRREASTASNSDAMTALRGTLEMCGPLLGLELLRDTLSLAQQAMAELGTDPALSTETAHRAAGAAMMSGLHDLGRALRDLEQLGRGPENPDALPPITARLADTVARAERLVAELELELESQVVDAVT